MGFLDGLTTLLGGFSDVKQIDEEGFDFREKRKAAQDLQTRRERTGRRRPQRRRLSGRTTSQRSRARSRAM